MVKVWQTISLVLGPRSDCLFVLFYRANCNSAAAFDIIIAVRIQPCKLTNIHFSVLVCITITNFCEISTIVTEKKCASNENNNDLQI